jgi:hypothetical protein
MMTAVVIESRIGQDFATKCPGSQPSLGSTHIYEVLAWGIRSLHELGGYGLQNHFHPVMCTDQLLLASVTILRDLFL